MEVTPINRQRFRAVLIAREWKWVLCVAPELAGWRGPQWLWRALCLASDGKPHRAGEIILADLRDFAGLDRPSIFDPDPHTMAYREGKRATVMRIINYLNLDESTVQKLMEVDDGLG